MSFADDMRQARLRRGYTQRDLAWHVGVTQAFVSLAERGLRWPTLDVLQRWVRVLGVRVVVDGDGVRVERRDNNREGR